MSFQVWRHKSDAKGGFERIASRLFQCSVKHSKLVANLLNQNE
ncbi:hypothetical protein F6453_3206 [Marinobacter nauticus]|uniref:Uncharacterized protein n=1 Tax=Marinobacter nauticus TaxID=2743 RepID=A0A833N6Z7_MARNT|nr:hypothetical protein F6453_3206 [Marinobacter nauticus]